MKKFKVAQIVPVSQLNDIENNQYHMCLAHLVAQDEVYANFYKALSSYGKYVLMDNGEAEGEQLQPDELIKMYERIKPTEIVLPDTLKDCNDTLRKTLSFVEEYGDLPYKFMGVPQGQDINEWCDCVNVMLRNERISSIGVSKFLNIATQNAWIRYHAVAYITFVAHRLGRNDVEVHLLGCDEGPAIVKRIQETFPIVRGCDSAFCYIACQAGAPMVEDMKRPKGEIDFLHGSYLQSFQECAQSFEALMGVKDNKEVWSWR